MKGRTRSFFEDVFVLLIIGVAIFAIYYFFFYGNKKEEAPLKTNVTVEKNETVNEEVPTIKDQEVKIQDENKSDINKTIPSLNNGKKDQLNILDKKTSNEKIKQNIDKKKEKQESTKSVYYENNTTSQKVDPKRIAYLMKNVDLKVLKEFKENTKQHMQDMIIVDNNISKEKQDFSIRVTVLKNGDFEQLICTGGNKELCDKNKENLQKVFPLKLDPKIIQDFPRYLRYTFKFSEKDN